MSGNTLALCATTLGVLGLVAMVILAIVFALRSGSVGAGTLVVERYPALTRIINNTAEQIYEEVDELRTRLDAIPPAGENDSLEEQIRSFKLLLAQLTDRANASEDEFDRRLNDAFSTVNSYTERLAQIEVGLQQMSPQIHNHYYHVEHHSRPAVVICTVALGAALGGLLSLVTTQPGLWPLVIGCGVIGFLFGRTVFTRREERKVTKP